MDFVVMVLLVVGLIVFIKWTDKQETGNVKYAIVKQRTKIMKTKSVPSGFSIGSKGSFRSYWRFKDEVDRIEVEFEVHYLDGRVATVKADEDSGKYDKLMSYVGLEPKPKPKVVIPPRPRQETGAVAVLEKTEAKTTEVPQKPKDEKRYSEVPFEVAPNEFDLQINYPSCQMVRRSDGSCRIDVRFEITYDPTVKGVRNRCVKCATIDSSGRMTAVKKEWKVLDLSGSKLVEIDFTENADQEPAKIVVSLDRYN